MQTDPEMIQQQPSIVSTGVSPQSTVPVKETKVLGVWQIAIGVISFTVGIAVIVALQSYWVGRYGFAIWGGVWVCIANCLSYISVSHGFQFIF